MKGQPETKGRKGVTRRKKEREKNERNKKKKREKNCGE